MTCLLANEAQGKDWRGDRCGEFCLLIKKRKTASFYFVDEILESSYSRDLECTDEDHVLRISEQKERAWVPDASLSR